MEKCELALNVAFPSPESVKVAETEPVLAPASPAPSHIICTLWKTLSPPVDYLLTSFTAMCGSGGTDSFSEGPKLKHTSRTLIQRDYDLNHCQPGRREARWHRLTVRGVIILVSVKLLTHIITPSPLEKKKKDCRSVRTLKQS